MDTINAAKFKTTCLALLDRVAKTGEPIRITKRGKPIAQLAATSRRSSPPDSPPLPQPGKHQILGCMAGTAKIVGDIVSPATDLSDSTSDWEALP